MSDENSFLIEQIEHRIGIDTTWFLEHPIEEIILGIGCLIGAGLFFRWYHREKDLAFLGNMFMSILVVCGYFYQF
jgi:hypothetical protein